VELRPAPWVAANKATAVGHKRVRVETAVGGESCTRRSRGRRSLLCVRVREATNHGEVMMARPTGAQPRAPTQEKGHRWGARLREGDVPGRTRART
jgi:hypothetical protein